MSSPIVMLKQLLEMESMVAFHFVEQRLQFMSLLEEFF